MDIIKHFCTLSSTNHTTITVSMIVLRIYAHFPNKSFIKFGICDGIERRCDGIESILNMIMNASVCF